jgi:hydrogenase expression/formation protein HypE
MSEGLNFGGSCPFPIENYPTVQMAHGGGGRLMGQLIETMFLSAFGAPEPGDRHDSAVLESAGGKMAFTTDGYVVRPMFFPGGDLGSLSVHGTVNDLAMAGAQPQALSASFILEEGLEMDKLWRIVSSMAAAAKEAGVSIVTGDTKVVDKGKGDEIFITTAGVGWVAHERSIRPAEVRAGDAVIVSGDLGRHGMAIMAVREGLEFESAIESDSASVAEPALALLEAGLDVHCLRDLTRGGLTSTLNEIAGAAGVGIEVTEADVPVRGDVNAACEFLGLDAMQVACEGRFAAFVAGADAERALEVLRGFGVSGNAAVVGKVTEKGDGRVILASRIGAKRILDLPAGEQLPRIC